MKRGVLRILSAVLCLVLLSGLCSCTKKPDKAYGDNDISTENTVKSFKPQRENIYSFAKDDGSYILQFALTVKNEINFRIYINNADTDGNDAMIFTCKPIYENGKLKLSFSDDFTHFEILCDSDTATVASSTKELNGAYHSIAIDLEEKSPVIPSLPEYKPDTNTDGFEMDSILAKAIRKSQGLAPDTILTKELLSKITELSIYDEQLVSLKGIEYITNLERFQTDTNFLRDISELEKLKELEDICIGSGYIKSLPDLSGMKKLESLMITGNLISDISPIAKSQSLKYINLASNRITSIAPIKDIKEIEMLELASNCIIDFSSAVDNENIRKAMSYTGVELDDCIAVEKRAKQIINEIISDDMTELEKEYTIFRYVIDHTEYNEIFRKQMPFGYYGIIKGFGVCGDYAQEFALLARTAGLDAVCVSSDTHAWNMVRLGDKYYQVDTLWDDDTNSEKPEYFNRSSTFILSQPDHKYDLNKYPIADEMDILLYAQFINFERND